MRYVHIKYEVINLHLLKGYIVKHLSNLLIVIMTLLSLTLPSVTYATKPSLRTANISWYGGHHHGRKTASGKRFNMHALTAAHKSLPFGSRVEIINPSNRKRVIVTINDRGPYYGNRKFDVSRAAAKRLGMLKTGTAHVKYRIISKGRKK